MAEGGAAAEREARRRKIAERGSDRMALITGRAQNLPPMSPSSSSSSSYSPSTIRSSQAEQSLLPPLPNSNRSHFRNKTEGDVPDKPSMEHTGSSKFSREKAFNYRKGDPPLLKRDTNTPTMPDPAREEEKKPLIPPKMSTSSSTRSKNFLKQMNIYSAKEINSCIVATESTRVFCSVVIALLVVLSNINLPNRIVKSTSTIASRPLYILLVSDVAIVMLKLLQKRRVSEKIEEDDDKIEQRKDGPNWLEAVQILEIGLVFYQMVRALFIDISCYTVVVVCGLSLV